MKPSVQVTLGFVAAVALLWVAVWLWVHNWIVFAAPVGALALGAAWVGIDNAFIYPAQRARREAALSGESDTAAAAQREPVPASEASDPSQLTVPR